MEGGGGENFVMSSNIKTREKKRTKDNYLKYSLYEDELNPRLPYKENVNTRREKTPKCSSCSTHLSIHDKLLYSSSSQSNFSIVEVCTLYVY